MGSQTSAPSRGIFVSYSHEDKDWLDKIWQRLPEDARRTTWTDNKIKPGDKWKEEIERALDGASAAVLLVTQAFVQSKFIANSELPAILSAAKSRGLQVLWVPVKSSSYAMTDISNYQAVGDAERPLAGLHGSDLEDALRDIAARIRDAVQSSVAQPSIAHFKDERWRQTRELCDYIQKHPPGRIDILQFSITALWSHEFWSTYKSCRDCKVRILLMRPERAERRYSSHARKAIERVAEQIAELDSEQGIDPRRPTVGLWYYDHAPSVAAVIVDEGLIQLGWYFVRIDPAHPERLRVSGHDAPGVMAFGEDAKILLPKVRAHFDNVLAGIKEAPQLYGPKRTELMTEWREICGATGR